MRRPSSQRSTLSHALLPLFSLIPDILHALALSPPPISLSSLRLKNIVSFGRAFSPNRVFFHNSAAYKGKKKISYFQACKNNFDTFRAFCRLMDLDKQHKDREAYLVFLGFMRKMAYLETFTLFST